MPRLIPRINSSSGEFAFLCALDVLHGEIRKAQHGVRGGAQKGLPQFTDHGDGISWTREEARTRNIQVEH
jgi:hypothetical protein